MTPRSLLLPTYAEMLKALSGWLEKAGWDLPAEEADRLMVARLAPDMFPLATQVRFACVQAIEGMHRLAQQPFPPMVDMLLEEGRSAGEAPGTIAQARARIDETLALVDRISEGYALDPAPQAPLEHALPMGIVFDLTVEQYVRDWALPQFFFHLMAAYAILRAQGVPLGKADYVQHMFAHVRPGTMPTA